MNSLVNEYGVKKLVEAFYEYTEEIFVFKSFSVMEYNMEKVILSSDRQIN